MRRDGIEVALAATVGAVIALVVWAFMQNPDSAARDDQRSSDSTTANSTTANSTTADSTTADSTTAEGPTANGEAASVATIQPPREQADLDDFLAAFRSSRTGTYKVAGRVQLAQAGTEDTNQIDVSIVRRGTDAIEVVGTTLLVSLDGREQSCERVFGDELICGEVLTPAEADDEVAGLEALFIGTDPDYLLYEDEPGCWQLVATSNPAPAQWGQSTTICFDESGAIARQTTSSMQGTRTFVAETITPAVTDRDLIPPS